MKKYGGEQFTWVFRTQLPNIWNTPLKQQLKYYVNLGLQKLMKKGKDRNKFTSESSLSLSTTESSRTVIPHDVQKRRLGTPPK